MTVHIVISSAKGSQRAIAAFTSKDQAEDFVERFNYPNVVFAVHDIEDEDARDIRKIFAAHQAMSGNAFVLLGFFHQRFKAQLSLTGNGFVKPLAIDADPAENYAEDVIFVGNTTSIEPPNESGESTTQALDPMNLPPTARKRRLVETGGALNFFFVLIIILLLLNTLVYTTKPKENYKENLDQVDWLPLGFTGVSFYMHGDFQTFEYSASEDAFKSWAAERSLEYRPINEKETAIVIRYTFDAGIPIETPEGVSEERAVFYWKKATRAEIENGFVITGSNDPQVGKITGGYNREEQRGYYRGIYP